MLATDGGKERLLVLDGLVARFLQALVGEGEHPDRQIFHVVVSVFEVAALGFLG